MGIRRLRSWIQQQLASISLASDWSRMVVAILAASITRLLLWYVLVDLTGWISEESLVTPVPLFATYFFFCIYYFVLCHTAFGKMDSSSLRSALRGTRPKERDPWLAFISGESGTSHATMFSVAALIGVGAVAFRPDGDHTATQSTVLQIVALLTVLGSWISNVASFALQYARDDSDGDQTDFRFPDGIRPTWSDYIYTAIMVSATLSTADVDVVSRERRRMVSIHTIIAFAFNTVIIAMLVATIV